MLKAIRLLIGAETRIPTIDEERLCQNNDGSVLVSRAALGDSRAFGKFYEMYQERIFRYVFYQVRDKMTAEYLTEEIFMKAWRAIASFSGKGQSLSTWLYRIARNHIEEVAQSKLMQGEVLDLVSMLPEQQKEIVILKFVEQLDNREIAQITGRSQGSIRIAQMRALATLRQKINEVEEQCVS